MDWIHHHDIVATPLLNLLLSILVQKCIMHYVTKQNPQTDCSLI